MAYLTWLAAALRTNGCKVVEIPGWEKAGRGEMGVVKGVLLHHTAGPAKGDAPSLDLVVTGRPDLPGPLSHLVLGRDGTFHVVAAGRCNHAGAGAWQGITSGNSSFIGIEAENMGTGADPWPQVQMDAYARGVAALLIHLDADAVMAAGHKEYALPKGRKIDPSFDMIAFRDKVEGYVRLLTGKPTGARPSVLPEVAPTDPERAMLRKGDMGESVEVLQRELNEQQHMGLPVDGNFGPATQSAVMIFQHDHGLLPDGLVGPATWKALGVS